MQGVKKREVQTYTLGIETPKICTFLRLLKGSNPIDNAGRDAGDFWLIIAESHATNRRNALNSSMACPI